MEFEGIFSPTIVFVNEEGKTAFEMKRKGEEYGQLYYIFKIYKENFNEEQLRKWPIAWHLIKSLAAVGGIPLHDSNEIAEAIEAKYKMVLETSEGKKAQEKANKTGEIVFVKDIDIKVFDHATERISTLTIGVSVSPDTRARNARQRGLLKRHKTAPENP